MPRNCPTWRPWTQADYDTAEEMRVNGAKRPEIAARLNRSPSAVSMKSERIGKRLSTDARWLELFQAGKTATAAAAEMRLTRRAAEAAKWRLRRAGFNLPRSAKGPKPRTTKGTDE